MKHPSSTCILSVVVLCIGITTAGNAVMTNLYQFAVVEQDQHLWCRAASTEAITRYYGSPVSKCTVVNDYRASRGMPNAYCCATYPEGICNMTGTIHDPLNKYGYNALRTTYSASTMPAQATFAKLVAQINPPGIRRPTTRTTLGRPVACEWKWDGGGKHIMVVSGTGTLNGRPHVTVQDSEGGNVWFVEYSYYQRSWENTGEEEGWAHALIGEVFLGRPHPGAN